MIELSEFYPWEYVISYDDVVQFCDFFDIDDDFCREIPAFAEGSFENMPDYA